MSGAGTQLNINPTHWGSNPAMLWLIDQSINQSSDRLIEITAPRGNLASTASSSAPAGPQSKAEIAPHRPGSSAPVEAALAPETHTRMVRSHHLISMNLNECDKLVDKLLTT